MDNPIVRRKKDCRFSWPGGRTGTRIPAGQHFFSSRPAKSTPAGRRCQRGKTHNSSKSKAFSRANVGLQRLGEVGGFAKTNRAALPAPVAANKQASTRPKPNKS